MSRINPKSIIRIYILGMFLFLTGLLNIDFIFYPNDDDTTKFLNGDRDTVAIYKMIDSIFLDYKLKVPGEDTVLAKMFSSMPQGKDTMLLKVLSGNDKLMIYPKSK
jgi:hypothetical protein